MTTDHIKMLDVEPLACYLANGTQTDFIYGFPVFAASDIAVYFDGARQYSGYDVTGAGETAGGTVSFDNPPAEGVVVMIEWRLPLERTTDFLEGGDFSARAINNELDFLTAAIQQVGRDQSPMLRYSDDEAPGEVILPARSARAGMALGFDEDGDPVAVSLEGSMAAPDFTANGTGAETRTSTDKFGDMISVKDFGATGDGLTDDTLAIQQALAAHNAVYVPPGTYLVTAPITVGSDQSLYGAGMASVIKANSNSFVVIELPARRAIVSQLQIQGGAVGIKLWGRDAECTQNNVTDVLIDQADIGILLDGYTDTAKPCYWNNFARVLIERMATHGVHMTLTGAGDTPNANRFYNVRTYSHGTGTTGSGFYIEHGSLNNSFVDCESNVNGATAHSCFRVGPNAYKTLIVNLLTEASDGLPNVRLDSGSSETVLINLTAMSSGYAIDDLSGGDYDAVNAGYPDSNRLRKTLVTDMKAALMRYDSEYIDTPGTHALDLSNTVHIVDAYNGAITLTLPAASDATGATITIKKIDNSANIITIEEDGGDGPDGRDLKLGGEDDYATLYSNGTYWFIVESNRMAGSVRYADTTGTYQIDMVGDVYLISSYGGAVTAQLPPASAAQAVGRIITIKKTDPSSNAVTVTEQGGAGPDAGSVILSTQNHAVTVVSNSVQWYVLGKLS